MWLASAGSGDGFTPAWVVRDEVTGIGKSLEVRVDTISYYDEWTARADRLHGRACRSFYGRLKATGLYCGRVRPGAKDALAVAISGIKRR